MNSPPPSPPSPLSSSGERVVAVIPARMASTRFPGKVLADRTGRPLIQHVYEAARRSRLVGEVVVATDDGRVRDAVLRFGGRAVMTRADHPNGTSRLAEAAAILNLDGEDIVVNVQGDEPEMDPALIDAAVGTLRSSAAPVATVAVPFAAPPHEDATNPNVVKVVLRLDGRALYFSRSLIPFIRDTAGHDQRGLTPLRHVGLYAYRRRFLDQYVALAPTPLEGREVLEQLRILEHGFDLAVAVVESAGLWGGGIDTPEQYDAFVRRWDNRT